MSLFWLLFVCDKFRHDRMNHQHRLHWKRI